MLKEAVRFVDRLSYGLLVLSMLGMVSLVTAQVFMRFVLNSSIDSADEISRLFFVWAIFLAIPHGVKYGIHVGIDLVVSRFSQGLKEHTFRAVSGFSALLMALVAYAAWIAIVDKWPELMPTINFTAAVYYIPVLFCAVHSFIHLVIQAWCGRESVDQEAF
jgi:TRAP-type transport system small permease protein